METSVLALTDGTIAISASAGDTVKHGELLMTMKAGCPANKKETGRSAGSFGKTPCFFFFLYRFSNRPAFPRSRARISSSSDFMAHST